MARYRVAEVRESDLWLHERLDGQTDPVYLILRKFSATSGLRRITPILMPRSGAGMDVLPVYLGFHVARSMGLRYRAEEQTADYTTFGENSGHALVSGLSQRLYGRHDRLTYRWL